MAPDTSSAWRITRFEDALLRWTQIDAPDEDTTLIVTNWVFNRVLDPYVGVRRYGGHPNLWFGAIPGTLSADGRSIVTCSYLIFERPKILARDNIARLHLPI